MFWCIISASFGVEEDEVTPEIPFVSPFSLKDLAHRMREKSSHGEACLVARLSSALDYQLALEGRSRAMEIDVEGSVEMLRDEDFAPNRKRKADLEIALPIGNSWTLVRGNYYMWERNGEFSLQKNSRSVCAEAGTDSRDWGINCSARVGSAVLEGGTARAAGACLRVSRDYGTGRLYSSINYSRETAYGSTRALGCFEIGNVLSVHDRFLLGGGVYVGGWDRLRIFPRIRIVGTDGGRFLVKTEYAPRVQLIGSDEYARMEFSVGGVPREEVHQFEWSGELVWFLNALNSIGTRVDFEAVRDPVIWEWDSLRHHLTPYSFEEYSRRTVGIWIEGGYRDLVNWYMDGNVSRCIDGQGDQIPNCPLSESEIRLEVHPDPFVLRLDAHHLGKRFMQREERVVLGGVFLLSVSLGLRWERACIAVGLENLTDEKYELFPDLLHKGRKYVAEIGLTTPR